MLNYEINNNTIALIYDSNKTIVYEKNNKFILDNVLPNKIIKYSCEYFGSSYDGRVKGTNKLTGITHKVPIIIEESNEIIFFPTTSSRLNECSWIRNKYIKSYRKMPENKVEIEFIDNNKIYLNCSYETINNQILRSSRLESIIRYRKI
ncbi:MAG: competence protein ComK [Bacilli bacterium]|nr:competence protein ComK [Bacilli bacterium]